MNAKEWEEALLDGCFITANARASAMQVAQILADKDAQGDGVRKLLEWASRAISKSYEATEWPADGTSELERCGRAIRQWIDTTKSPP